MARLRAAVAARPGCRRRSRPDGWRTVLAEARARPAAVAGHRRTPPPPTPSWPADVPRPRVVVLGGGMAGLATAWELSSGDWRQRLDSITVYQRGWRLGGKGASSRGPHGRIEEHGLHVLLGYYDATFRVLREVYAELDRAVTDPACPIRDVARGGRARRRTSASPTATATALAPLRHPVLRQRRPPRGARRRGPAAHPARRRHARDAAAGRLPPRACAPSRTGAGSSSAPRRPPARRRPTLGTLPARRRPHRPGRAARGARARVAAAPPAACARSRSPRRWPPRSAPSRDGIRAAVSGRPGDAPDLAAGRPGGHQPAGHGGRRAARRHGLRRASTTSTTGSGWPGTAPPPDTLDSPIVRGMYDLTFAYEGGDRARPALRGRPRVSSSPAACCSTSRASIFWRMQAGMGEVVFAPDLPGARPPRAWSSASSTGSTELRLAGGPLRRRRSSSPGRPTWPPAAAGTSRWSGSAGCPAGPTGPLADQLAADPGDGSSRTGARRTEPGRRRSSPARTSTSPCWPCRVGMVPHVAAELVAADPAWRRMVDRVATVATRSAQLWLDAAEAELGWPAPPGVTLSRVRRHLRHLGIDGAPAAPGGVALRRRPRAASPTSAVPCPTPIRRPGDGRRPGDAGGASSTTRWGRCGRAPRAAGGFRWDAAPGRRGAPRTGPAARASTSRANLDPSDRYVQSLPGSGRYRLAPGRTGFANLALAGDWTACGLDAGCLEAATRSGVLAARAVLSGAVARRHRAGRAA